MLSNIMVPTLKVQIDECPIHVSRSIVSILCSHLGSDLWIVMEYCGGGSVSDIMRLRKKTLTEEEIATILQDTLLGMQLIEEKRKKLIIYFLLNRIRVFACPKENTSRY